VEWWSDVTQYSSRASSMEKLYTLSFYELRLLVRSRRRLLCALCLPLVGGLFFGVIARKIAEFPAGYGLFLILPMSSLFLAVERGISVRSGNHLPAHLVKPGLSRASRAAADLPVLAVQAAAYAGVTALLEPQSAPGLGIAAGALAASLVVGLLADGFRPP